EVEHSAWAERIRLPFGGPVPEEHEALRVGKGQRPQQRGVDHAENSRVGADAERERQDGHRGEARRLRQPAQRIDHVLSEIRPDAAAHEPLDVRKARRLAGMVLAELTAVIHDLWYKNAVIYCLNVETYIDSDGDG